MHHERHETLPAGRGTDLTLLLTAVLAVVLYVAWVSGTFSSTDHQTLAGAGSAAPIGVATVTTDRGDTARHETE